MLAQVVVTLFNVVQSLVHIATLEAPVHHQEGARMLKIIRRRNNVQKKSE